MKNKLIRGLLIPTAISIVTVFSMNTSFAATTAKVNVSTANLRESANSNSKIIQQLSKDKEVEVVEKDGEWYKVKVNEITGYLRQDLIDVSEDTATQNTTNVETTTNNKVNSQESTKQEQSNTTNNEQIVDNETDTSDNKEEVNSETEKNNKDTKKLKEDTKLKIVPVINAVDIIELNKNQEVGIVEKINGWVCIEKEEVKGWVREEKLIAIEESTTETSNTETTESDKEESEDKEEETSTDSQQVEEKVIKTLYVNSDLVNVRKEDSTSSEVVLKLKLNTLVDVYAELEEWYKVKVDGKEGYISKSLLSENKQEVVTSRGSIVQREMDNNSETEQKEMLSENTTNKGATIVETANKYMGYNYVSGGVGPNTFDCSGFTYYIYKLNGISLNRTAASQYSNGVSVSRNELQLGDLVMFGPSKSGINHVGIYIGGGRIIHAANPKRGVVTDTINSGYYNDNYVGARRVVK